MTGEVAAPKETSTDRQAVEGLWHVRRGFEVAFAIAYVVLVFGLLSHVTSHDIYLDSFLGSLIGRGGGALREVSGCDNGTVAGWLWWALSGSLFAAGGAWLVGFFAVALATAGFWVLLAVVRRTTSIAIAGPLLILAAYSARACFVPGGPAAGIFFLGLLSALVVGLVTASGRRFWVAVPLMMLWANIDVTWVAGACLCAGTLVALSLGQVPRRGEKMTAFAVALIATLANPDGYRLWTATLGLPFAAKSMNAWAAPIGESVSWQYWYVYAAAFAALVLAGLSRQWAALALAIASVLLCLKGLAAAWAGIAATSALGAVALALPSAVSAIARRSGAPDGTAVWIEKALGPSGDDEDDVTLSDAVVRKRYALAIVLSGAGVAACALLFAYSAVGSAAYKFGLDPGTSALPVKAVAFARENGLKGLVVTRPSSPAWAGYVLYSGWPELTVTADSRPLATREEDLELTAKVFGIAGDRRKEDIFAALDSAGVKGLIVQRDWPRAMQFRGKWVPVYWDDLSAVFVPRREEFAEMIARHDETLTYPPYFGFDLTRERIPDVIRRLSEKLKKDNDSAYVCYELGMCYYLIEDKANAALSLLVALRLDPRLAAAWHTLADIVRGRNRPALDAVLRELMLEPRLAREASGVSLMKEPEIYDACAAVLYNEAVAHDRDLAMAYLRLSEIYMRVGNRNRAIDCLYGALRADDRRPQLDKLKPGLRKELEAQITAFMNARAAAMSGIQTTDSGLAASSVSDVQSTGTVVTPPEAR